MLFYIAIGGVTLVILRFLTTQDPPKIKGSYSQPSKWFTVKFWIFRCLLYFRQRQNEKERETKGEDAGYGKRSRSSPAEMEKAQVLPEYEKHPLAVDAVYFNGANSKGEFFVGATARRQDNLIQTLLFLRFPDLGLLELPDLPDTAQKASEPNAFAAAGVKFEVVEPMKKWKLSYQGKLRLTHANSHDSEEVDVKFSLDWIAYTRFFDFDTDLHPHALCDAMAREKWDRYFFEQLRVAHQTHYEQFGEISGTIYIDGHGSREIKVQGVRDHSYGNIRDWKDLHRYGIQYLHLEDGTAVCIGNICMPRTLSRLVIGYIIHPNGQLDGVSSTDFELHELGEEGISPDEFEFNFVAAGKSYHLEGKVLAMPIFYMGNDWEARIHERMCFFKVNGVKGWGISEWDYRNWTGRPDHFKKKI